MKLVGEDDAGIVAARWRLLLERGATAVSRARTRVAGRGIRQLRGAWRDTGTLRIFVFCVAKPS